jgi:hypothetical protein
MVPVQNFVPLLGCPDLGEEIPNPVMAIPKTNHLLSQRLRIHPVDETGILSEKGLDSSVVKIDSFIVSPDARLPLGRSQSHFAPVKTHRLDGVLNLGEVKGLTMHHALLGAVRDGDSG